MASQADPPAVHFRTIPLRFEFEAQEPLRIPPGKAANTFRGALGMLLPQSVFSPRSGGAGPSGFEDSPRPFVIRAGEPQGRRLALAVNVFDVGAAPSIENAVESISQLGPHRQQVNLVDTTHRPLVEIDLTTGPPVDSLRLNFLTPMELKFGGDTLREPRFDALFARVRDRVSTLCTLYQGGAPEVDYRALGERARHVVMTRSRIGRHAVHRRSSRTGQTHSLGGFTGEAEYAGELAEFLPWLTAAEYTGAGRYTVWGNGALVVTGISHNGVLL